MLRAPLSPAVLSAVAVSVLLASANTARAQSAPANQNGWELLFSTGALVPTGVQRNVLKDAPLSTAQLSYVMRSRFAITTMVGWARSRDLASAGSPKLDVFTYDVGAEARTPRLVGGETMTLTPFVGVGAGSRSYNYRSLDVDATHNLAGYGALGSELARGRVHLRLEVRDYMTRFEPLAGAGASATRNDVVAILGLRLTRRRS
ncbi:MAG: hypothetical protein ACJ79A_15445 [Gemmatimonadaceae bacterium]